MPTVAEVLRLDVVQRGLPRVVAAADQLDKPVRWVHVIELPDAARLLHGGELVLSTGIALPDEGPQLDAYVAGLAGIGASALAVELGRKYTGALPAGFVAAAEANRLPLIVFQHEVPFVEITEAVHARIISDQLDQLRVSARLHEVFTDLAVAGAGPGEILRQASLLAGRPLLLEDLSHHVLACELAGADPAQLLAAFEARSRAVPASPRTSYHESPGWLVTTVGARGEDWGRVILVCAGPPSPVDTVLIERTATTLALGRLLARQQESLERQAHRTLISAILAGPDTDPDEVAAQARALGLPVAGRQLVTAVLRSPEQGAGLLAQARVLDLAEAMADACRAERIPVLVGSLDDVRAAAVLSVPSGADPEQLLDQVCEAVRRGLARRASRPYGMPGGDPVIGAGAPVSTVADVRRSLLEARQVADAAAEAGPAADGRPFYRLADLRLRGLLFLLGGDPRLATFVDRELGPLLRYDAAHGTSLTGVLAAYLAAGGNKADAASQAHLARPTLYDRLRHIERILGVDLSSAESRASLHVALLAHDGQPSGSMPFRAGTRTVR
jgi:PucR family transcriptional regulator, purine catabolism regulatory protein